MTLWILQNNFAATANQDLFRIMGSAGLAEISGSGRVTLRGSVTAVGDVLERVVNSPFPVAIRGEGPDFSTRPVVGYRLRDHGGETVFDRYPGTTSVEIVYDLSQCGGQGYWVLDPNGDRRAVPMYIGLFHELVHADELLRGALPPDLESGAIAGENRLRQRDGLVARVGHAGGCGPAPSPKAQSEAPPPTTGECFVATAAFGSDLDPSLDSLRAFRDGVLRATRAGATFFDEFYDVYSRVSIPVIAAMTADERVRELVRWSLVTPIVHYLEIAREFPDADFTAAPEPWRTFLEHLATKLENFASAVPWPTSFTDVGVDEAIVEISVLCRYAYRSPETRATWLKSLVAEGALPLRFPAKDRHRHASKLACLGRTDAEIDLILGNATSESQHEHRTPPVLTFWGEHVHERDASSTGTGTWFYSVNVRNLTPDTTFDSIDLFYKRRGLDGLVYLTEPNVGPGQIAPFVLGSCNQMESYVVAFIIGGEPVARFPDQGNMTPELASQLSPGDKEPCADSWSIN
jgi:hypothetical protein